MVYIDLMEEEEFNNIQRKFLYNHVLMELNNLWYLTWSYNFKLKKCDNYLYDDICDIYKGMNRNFIIYSFFYTLRNRLEIIEDTKTEIIRTYRKMDKYNNSDYESEDYESDEDYDSSEY